MSHNLRQ